tara:strand:+ start:292 stop:555 length:264 start_codon:yes stop_codon:yes gene_type:complete
MALKGQSIRSGVTIYIDGNLTSKQEIIELSKTWSPNQEKLFRVFLKQGGEIIIKGINIKITIQDTIVNSKGEKDQGVIIFPGIDQRF